MNRRPHRITRRRPVTGPCFARSAAGNPCAQPVPPRRFPMSAQAVLYIIAIILLAVAALPVPSRGFNLAILGAAVALLAYAWPIVSA
ncbi:hypothetical protein GCM10010532_114140 [Dactylosporangium siamense]